MTVDDATWHLTQVAQKRGVQVLRCSPGEDGNVPPYPIRKAIDRQVRKHAYEHLIVFVDQGGDSQVWQWVSKTPGRPVAYREHAYSSSQTGTALVQKLESIAFPLSDEEALTISGVTFRLRDAFDRDRITKRFYDAFKVEHRSFLTSIQGIDVPEHREWYASLMLNRLMFVYFIQRKGFLNGESDYLRNRLRLAGDRRGEGEFFSFYRHFLLRLFHDGLGSPITSEELDALLGQVPYLNGGLFDVHELEVTYASIAIPDEAFARLFDFFDAYDWHLDERPLRSDTEINPDVLGYIFEKYINQREMGAYYTKEDITRYIVERTVLLAVLESVCAAQPGTFETNGRLGMALVRDPEKYMPEALGHGVSQSLPQTVSVGIDDFSRRGQWNALADPLAALGQETWREHIERRSTYVQLKNHIENGGIRNLADLVTSNLRIAQLAQDVIEQCDRPELLSSAFTALAEITILDPTCGSGAFLFAALNVLEPLYESCIDGMQSFIDDAERMPTIPGQSESFQDFRATLGSIAAHPNRRYFVLKSIIINNLFGVDLMEEAVEICKLRLFLKLAAQLSDSDAIEPLPDIDFNIRAGNALVGVASEAELQRMFSTKFDLEGRVAAIMEGASEAAGLFSRFRELQAAAAVDATDLSNTKAGLVSHLSALEDDLDRLLASEYGVPSDSAPKLEAWRASHRPLHWLTAFFGIMSNGGFDVVLGNPPYIEYPRGECGYRVIGYDTIECGNLYAFTLERATKVARDGGRVGMIVPVSSIATDRYESLQTLLHKDADLWISSFNDRPGRLFEGIEHCRLSIIVTGPLRRGSGRVLATKYNRWHTAGRQSLFDRLTFAPVADEMRRGSIPKLGDSLALSIFQKVTSKPETLGVWVRRAGRHQIHYTRKLSGFVQILDFVPGIWDANGEQRDPSELKSLAFDTQTQRDVCLATLNSSLFYWLLTVCSDMRNLNKRDVVGMPLGLSSMSAEVERSLATLSRALMEDFRANSQVLEMNYERLGTLRIQCIYPKVSKALIDSIDACLAEHFDLSDAELDYIVNYDIKFRVGLDSGE